MEPPTGKPTYLRNVMVRVLLFGVLIIVVRFAYVVTITGETCNRGDFCFFALPENINFVIAGAGAGAGVSAIVGNDAVRSTPVMSPRHDLYTSKDWIKAIQFYSSIFQDLIADYYLSPDSKSLCVETAIGHEVFALKEIGVKDSVGISKKASRPLVIKGEGHAIPFDDNTFDFVFSGGGRLEKSPKQLAFAEEIVRTLKPEGFAVVHVGATDTYSFNSFLDLFNSCKLVKMRDIDGFDSSMPHIREIVIQKHADVFGHRWKNSGGESVGNCSVPGYKKDLIQNAEPLITEEPLKPWITLKRNIKNIKYLPSMVDISFKSKYVYVDVGARSYGSSIGSWFRKEYPKQNKTFDVFAIEADKAFHEEYKIKKKVQLLPYAAWVRNETLSFEINHDPGKQVKAGGRGMGRIQPVQSSSSSSSDFNGEVNLIQGFDFAEWLKKTVRERDFVVMKMDVEGTEFELIPRMIETASKIGRMVLFDSTRASKDPSSIICGMNQTSSCVLCSWNTSLSATFCPHFMGIQWPLGCNCKNADFRGIYVEDETYDKNEYVGEEDGGAILGSHGSSEHISMAIKQGGKGINQDAMTVWENFGDSEDMIFCGVFDGHGPMGHKIARHVRENLPSRIHSAITSSRSISDISSQNHEELFREFKTLLTKSFKYIDDEIGADSPYESFCSGSTAVTIIKRGDSLVIANLGDSRAVLCTRGGGGGKSQLRAIQLTVDLKPCVPGEAERIKACKGRVFAMQEEPEVYRVWMPDDDCPGLAMSRAFGDFCLKDYGLLSLPDVFYRRVTTDDQFVVLATDGIWDVLSNEEVVKVVSSAKDRSKAAEVVVQRATRAWKIKYPAARADDCSVVVLFLNHRFAPEDAKANENGSAVSWRSRSSRKGARVAESVGTDTVKHLVSGGRLSRRRSGNDQATVVGW